MFKLAEVSYVEESIKDSELDPMMDNIHEIVLECMTLVTSKDDSFVFVYKDYIVTIGYGQNYMENFPEGEFIAIISIASDKEKELYSEKPVALETEIIE